MAEPGAAPYDLFISHAPADRAWVEYVNKWIAQTRAGGHVKDVVLSNLQKLSGVTPEQIPPGTTF